MPNGNWESLTPPNFRLLSWEGRVLFEGESAHFDWTGVSVTARIETRAIAVHLDPRDNDFGLFLDGKLHAILGVRPILSAHPQLHLWTPAAEPCTWIFELPKGPHKLCLHKRTGANFGPAIFFGFRLWTGGKWLEQPPRKSLRIEFIGDSLTNAYGCESTAVDCTELRPWENSWKSWAFQVCRALDAEAQVIAVSGFGVVRNWGAETTTVPTPLLHFYPRCLFTRAEPLYDRSLFIPHAIVINLGNNDHSTEPVPLPEEFFNGFAALIEAAMQGRPRIPLIICKPTIRSSALEQSRIEEVAQRARQAGYDAEVVELIGAADHELGADTHPQEIVHNRWAATLLPVLQRKLKLPPR